MKTDKKVKRKLRVKLLLCILLVGYLIYMSIYYIITLKVDDIVITGNNYITDTQILELTNITEKTTTLSVTKKDIEKILLENPLIKTVFVKKTFTGDITITIDENKILFINAISNKVILEGNNEIEITDDILGVPTLINYTPDVIYEELIQKLSELDQSLINKISEIEYAPNIKDGQVLDEVRFIFKMNDQNTVHVNLVNFEKFNMYNDIMEIQKDKGTLYLDSNNSGHIFDIYEENSNELPE